MEDKRKTMLLAALIITGLLILITFPLRSLIAGCYFHRAVSLLKDPDSGKAFPVSGRTMPRYFEAIRSLEKASVVAFSKSGYVRALSELYTRMGAWAAGMELMGAPLPDETMNSKDAFRKAEHYLTAALQSEPADPGYHFALGYLSDAAERNSGRAEKELSRAIAAYPSNASLREAVAAQHLRAGRKGDAIEQAAMLAKIIDQNTPGDYLTRAFDIAWRASGDPQVVKGICPDEPWARKSAENFLKLRDIKQ